MDSNCTLTKNQSDILFRESECSDGMCCFTCVIPSNNGHIGFFKSMWKNGTGSPYVKLLATSEGHKNELYDSCKFLDFIISRNSGESILKMDLRCSIYKHRPRQCKDYPDSAGESLYQQISGPCIFNEYTASGAYKDLVYKRKWDAFYAILDDIDAIRNIFVNEDAHIARESLLKAEGVHLATISQGTEELNYILISLPKRTQNILYLSEKHQPVGTIEQAYHRWQEKIQKNLQNHYGTEWEAKLNNAIETEEKDAGKRCNEDTTGNLKR